MIKCVIIDDEPLAIQVIKGYVEKMPGLHLAGTAINPLQGIDLIQQAKADLVFLDIRMNEMNGLDVLALIDPAVKVVLCTAFSEFAVASYDLEVVDYLMKPIVFQRFVKAVRRATNALQASPALVSEAIADDYIFIKAALKGSMVKINLDDIDLIEGMNNYVAFHRGQEKILAYLTMKELEQTLPPSLFTRVHKSFIIPMKKITVVDGDELITEHSSIRIPIGGSYKQLFIEKMKNKVIGNK